MNPALPVQIDVAVLFRGIVLVRAARTREEREGKMHIVKKGRMVSVLLTIVLVLGLFQGNCADAASADDRYTSYNASSILKRYSVFVQRDYNANNHIIGAIAVGGTYKNSNFFGDVMTFPSYINNWESGGLGNGAVNSGVLNYLRSYGQSFGRVVYYGTKSVHQYGFRFLKPSLAVAGAEGARNRSLRQHAELKRRGDGRLCHNLFGQIEFVKHPGAELYLVPFAYPCNLRDGKQHRLQRLVHQD